MYELATQNARLNFINPNGLYDPRCNGYSHVAVAKGPGTIVYVAGQGGEDAAGGLSPLFARQVEQAMRNLRCALRAAGAVPSDVARLTVLVVDHSPERLRIVTAAIRETWGDAPAPACTLIPVPKLALEGMLFEIEATAVLAE